jgi:hypothetical protein
MVITFITFLRIYVLFMINVNKEFIEKNYFLSISNYIYKKIISFI